MLRMVKFKGYIAEEKEEWYDYSSCNYDNERIMRRETRRYWIINGPYADNLKVYNECGVSIKRYIQRLINKNHKRVKEVNKTLKKLSSDIAKLEKKQTRINQWLIGISSRFPL